MIDAVIVGSGHNALTAACYLANAGWSVEVLEKDAVAGGAVSTVERFPGHFMDRGSSAHIMVRHTGIIEELDLASHGLHYLNCDPWACAPGTPGTDEPPIVFSQDLDRTCESIATACGLPDARAYRRFVDKWGPRSSRTMRAFSHPPTGRHLLQSFWGLDAPRGGSALSREFLTSGDALLDGYFTSERLKAALAWFGAQSGPPMSEPGTASMVGFAALMHTLPPGRAVGGSGALTSALSSRLRSAGGTVTLGDGVTELRSDSGGWITETASGRSIRSRTVMAGCHISTTFDLLERGGYDAERLAQWRSEVRTGPGIGMVVRLATTSLPVYPGVESVDSTTGLQLLVHDRAQLRSAHGHALAGEVPPQPAVLGMSFTAVDPSTAPAGQHQISLWSQWHPYQLSGGRRWRGVAGETDPADFAEREGDRIVAQLEAHAPGFTSSILHRLVQSPVDIEAELGLIGGNIMHIEMSLDQMMMWRPLPELAGYRVPGVEGLYLTGASTHPGGGVSAASGRSAAAAAVSDQRWISRGTRSIGNFVTGRRP